MSREVGGKSTRCEAVNSRGRLLVAKLRQPVETICKLPFLLRFHSCDLIRDCLAELSHRRSQIPSPASWRRAGEIILASSGDIVGTEEWEGQYV
jgi:hypothetical protein